MLTRAMAMTLTALLIASWLNSSDAICKRPKETKAWKRKGLVERAVESDIVIYGEVISSPCWKPGFVKPTAPPVTTPTEAPSSVNSTNATSNATVPTTTPLTVNTSNPVTNMTTVSPTPPYNCSTEFYNVVIKVLCVMRGGSVPLYIFLRGLGHGEGVCLDESHHDHHAYNMLKYLIFIRRLKNPSGNEVFKINPINYQPAATEISNESDLEPIFEAVGRNARMPVGVRDATVHGMCKAYVSSAHAYCSSLLSLLLVLFASLFFLIY